MSDKMASLRKYRGTVVDVICVLVVGLTVLFYSLFGKAYKRGFFCDDESIRYPRQDETISTNLLTTVGFSLPTIVVLVVEGCRLFDTSTPRDSYKTVGLRLLKSGYQILGVFIFGAGLNQVTVDTSKYLIGRLRPHFYSVCSPNVNCNTTPAHVYISQYECAGDPDVVEEARLSFPSGHSAFAFYATIYTSMFLYHRMQWQGSVLLRHLLQGVLVLLAWFTALSRVHDYMHHPTDVLAGGVIGSLWAIFMTCFVIDMNLQNTNSQEEIRALRQTQIPNQHGPNYV